MQVTCQRETLVFVRVLDVLDGQHVDLPQLGDDLLGLVTPSTHLKTLPNGSKAILHGGPLSRGQTTQQLAKMPVMN